MEDSEERSKKIWLKIGKHVIEKYNDIKSAMRIIGESQILKVEDLMPYFPETILIDSFKEEIEDQTGTYDENIQKHKSEMEMVEKNTNILRTDLKKMGSFPLVYDSPHKCFSCRLFINPSKPYYYFFCGHLVHQNCLIRDVSETLDGKTKETVLHLYQEIQKWKEKNIIEERNARGAIITRADKIKEKLDDIIAVECLYCGNSIVDKIDVDFVGDEDEYQRSTWDI